MKNAILKAGWGFDVGQDFARAAKDTPVTLAPEEYAKPGCIIAYMPPAPESNLGFMRNAGPRGVRIHVQKSGLKTI
jgi:hypothetical protein